MTKPLMLVFVSIAVLLTVGCGKVRYPRYYTLAVAPPLQPVAYGTSKRATVAVRGFQTPAYLRQGRIVYRESPNEVGFYEYHRWAADPGATVTTAVIETLRSSGPFALVEPYDGHDKPDYLLTGRLERLDEVDDSAGVRVEVKVSAQLLNLRTSSSVWASDVFETSRVDTRTMSSVVDEMSHTLEKSVGRLLAKMELQLGDGALAATGSPSTVPEPKPR